MNEMILKDFLKNCKCVEDVLYHNETAIGKLNDTLNVKIELWGGIEADSRYGLNVQVINKTTGLIDAMTFCFSDVIGRMSVSDGSHPIYKLRRFDGKKFEWYLGEPTALQKRKIMERVYQYIELYK